jgi:hypothetical protein
VRVVVDITRGLMNDARTSLLPSRCLSSTCGELYGFVHYLEICAPGHLSAIEMSQVCSVHDIICNAMRCHGMSGVG